MMLKACHAYSCIRNYQCEWDGYHIESGFNPDSIWISVNMPYNFVCHNHLDTNSYIPDVTVAIYVYGSCKILFHGFTQLTSYHDGL